MVEGLASSGVNWFSRFSSNKKRPVQLYRALTRSGVLLKTEQVTKEPGVLGAAHAIQDQQIGGLLSQLEDEGLLQETDHGRLLDWDSVYRLSATADFSEIAKIIALPESGEISPLLRSTGSLTDTDFNIHVAGWRDGAGRPVRDAEAEGALIKTGNSYVLMPAKCWQLMNALSDFRSRPKEAGTADHRAAWGKIRSAALDAGANLDEFLFRTVVLSPEKLQIGLRKGASPGDRVVEIIPSFPSAPDEWLAAFDRSSLVPGRYDLPTEHGIVQIVLSPEVKSVLQEIKKLPGRRVAGARAEAFLSNPFSALGEDAAAVIEPEQFEEAKEKAGITSERFTAHIERDAVGYPEIVGVLIERLGRSGLEASEIVVFTSDDELDEFNRRVRSCLDSGLQFCGWNGFDLELFGETADQVALLENALRERKEPRVLVSYADVYDLSRYTDRIETIGQEKPYYSPFIAKKKDDDGWFPDNVIPVISWTPEGQEEAVAVPVTPAVQAEIRAKIDEAKRSGQTSLTLKGFDKPVPVSEAEFVLETFEAAGESIKKGDFKPENFKSKAQHDKARVGLVIRANIQSIDYEEARRNLLLALPGKPELPKGLRPEIALKEHQHHGVLWLQHLYTLAPDQCRGAVLADDMGLGKTLQILTLICWLFENKPESEPALIVAPVSLLENWKLEVEKFFKPGVLPVLTAYGDSLKALRLPRESIDKQLAGQGLVKFLKPDWTAGAKVVLTTYETLRDLEFSFAQQKWSLMVCDEAQKIKNPNAMVTRATKKQHVRFKLACTGTPVENTLADLWCLFDFIQPGLLGALNDFGQRYRKPIEAETAEELARVAELRAKIQPQILRRLKKDVAKDLREKIIDPGCKQLSLSDYQRSLYGQAVELFKNRHEKDSRSPFQNHLGLLHYLRLICTDPRRIGLDVFTPEPISEYRRKAPKLEWLLLTLKIIRDKNEKAIVFCEFKNIQRMLRHYIEEALGVSADIINGDTSASSTQANSRQKRIDAFQRSHGFNVIILSPVAVGFGLNIQAANHVIHYTRTWNPAKEDQATDRAYRIGQTKDVFVYCPTVRAADFKTFDVRLDELLTAKRALADDMLNGTGEVEPGDFGIDDVVPGSGTGSGFDIQITVDVARQMKWDYFEGMIAVLWQRRGNKTVYKTPVTDDAGVDVVAINGKLGALIQCKTSGSDGITLGWDAIKDVIAGEATYRMKHPKIEFQRVCVTNQYFNDNAHKHAALNKVELIDQDKLGALLSAHPITMKDVEKAMFKNWG